MRGRETARTYHRYFWRRNKNEYEEKIAEYAKEYGMGVDEYKEQIGEELLKNTILRETVVDYLIKECVEVEQSGTE